MPPPASGPRECGFLTKDSNTIFFDHAHTAFSHIFFATSALVFSTRIAAPFLGVALPLSHSLGSRRKERERERERERAITGSHPPRSKRKEREARFRQKCLKIIFPPKKSPNNAEKQSSNSYLPFYREKIGEYSPRPFFPSSPVLFPPPIIISAFFLSFSWHPSITSPF